MVMQSVIFPKTRQDLSDFAYQLQSDPVANAGTILFVGGQASTVQGRPLIYQLAHQILLEQFGTRYSVEEIQQMQANGQMTNLMFSFERKWLGTNRNKQTNSLRKLHEQLVLTEGHIALANLLKKHFFLLVLATATDQLLESAYISNATQEGQRAPAWKVVINGYSTPNDFQVAIQTPSDATFIKLCGDIDTFAVTSSEADLMLKDPIKQEIRKALNRNRDLVIVCPTLLDEHILSLLFQDDQKKVIGRIIFINSSEPSQKLRQEMQQWDPTPTYIIDGALTFDLVFQTIADQHGLYQDVEKIAGRSLTEADLQKLRQEILSSNIPDEVLERFFKREAPQEAAAPQSPPSQADTPPTIKDRVSDAPKPTSRTPVSQTPPAKEVEDEDLVVLIDDEDETSDDSESVPHEYIEWIETTVFTINVRPDRKANFTALGGKINSKSPDSVVLPINPEKLNELMLYMGQNLSIYHKMGGSEAGTLLLSWLKQIEREGNELNTSILEAIPDLNKTLEVARKTAARDDLENVTLLFGGPRQYLNMPYELIYYNGKPLVVQHPFCHQVTEEQFTYKEKDFDSFFRTLKKQRQHLRVLLVSSSATSDQEVRELEKLIDQKSGLKTTIHTLLSNQISEGSLTDCLRRSTYHIVHYVGYGTFDETSGQNNGLLLLKRDKLREESSILTAEDVARLLDASETRLFYLNPYSDTGTNGSRTIPNSNQPGMMDALVRAGIPYILGFRWHITESNSLKFATTFYEKLFKHPLIPEKAALYARQAFFEGDEQNDTWTSPILVAQTPYR